VAHLLTFVAEKLGVDICDTCVDIRDTCVDIRDTCVDIRDTCVDIRDTCVDIRVLQCAHIDTTRDTCIDIRCENIVSLQHTATHCSTLQHTAAHCIVRWTYEGTCVYIRGSYIVLDTTCDSCVDIRCENIV